MRSVGYAIFAGRSADLRLKAQRIIVQIEDIAHIVGVERTIVAVIAGQQQNP